MFTYCCALEIDQLVTDEDDTPWFGLVGHFYVRQIASRNLLVDQQRLQAERSYLRLLPASESVPGRYTTSIFSTS